MMENDNNIFDFTLPAEGAIPLGGEEKPEVILAEEKPEVILAEEKPEVILAEEKPEVILAEEKPEVILAEEKPEVVPEADLPAFELPGSGFEPIPLFDEPVTVELPAPEPENVEPPAPEPETTEPEEPALNDDWSVFPVFTPNPDKPKATVALLDESFAAEVEQDAQSETDDEADQKPLPRREKTNGAGCAVISIILIILLSAILWLVYTFGPWVYFDGQIYNISTPRVDMTGKTDFDTEDYAYLSGKMPNTEIIWNVPISGETYPSTQRDMSFAGRTDLDFDDIFGKIGYFRYLRSLDMSDTGMTVEQYETLSVLLPDGCYVRWSVPLAGDYYQSSARELNLSGNENVTYDELRQNLGYFTHLDSVALSDCGLTDDQLIKLRTEICPKIWWRVDGFGLSFASNAKDVELDLIGQGVDVGELASFLRCFESTVVVTMSLEDCDDEQLKVLMNANPNASIKRFATLFGELYDVNAEKIRAVGVKVDTHDTKLISNFVRLSELELIDCGITDVRFISDLDTLKKLVLSRNDISNAAPLGALTGLEILDVSENKIIDISAFEALVNVRQLDISYNSVHDFSALSSMTALEKLSVRGCGVYSVPALAGALQEHKHLTELDVSENDITLIAPLTKLEHLEVLRAEQCGIQFTTAFGSFKNVRELYLSGNVIKYITSIADMENLRTLDLSYNRLKFLNEFEVMAKLEKLNISHNDEVTEARADALEEKLSGCAITR